MIVHHLHYMIITVVVVVVVLHVDKACVSFCLFQIFMSYLVTLFGIGLLVGKSTTTSKVKLLMHAYI